MKKGPRKRAGVEKLLEGSSTPLFALASDRTVTFFNSGCEQLTGWTAADLLGLVCEFNSTADARTPQSLANSLCPPADVFKGQEQSVAAYLAHREGASVPRMLHFFPLLARGKVTAVLGHVLPIKPPAAAPPVSPILQWHAELAALRGTLRQRFSTEALVADGAEMQKVLSQIALAQQTTAFVCLQGEPGSGKEHLARVIHYGSPQRANWFVPLDCARLDPDELRSVLGRLLELHAGPVMGGTRPQPGTLYLADVEALPRDLQQQLAIAFLDGPPQSRPGLRLICSSTQDLRVAVTADRFRDDLFSLLTVLTVEVPPLRERISDLPLLAQHFLEESNRGQARQLNGLAPEVVALFGRYHWPGNLDELQGVIREAAAKCEETHLRPADLPSRLRLALDAQSHPPPVEPPQLPLDEMLTKLERTLIELALERAKQNKSKAADILRVNRPRLYRRMEQLGIADITPGSTEERDADLGDDLPGAAVST